MARFVPGQPVVTAAPSVVVDAGMPVGQHLFRLEVVTDTGQRSPPDEAVVQVQASTVLVDPVPTVVSPTVATTLTPVVSPRTVLSPATTTGDVLVAPTLPKTVSPSIKSRVSPVAAPSAGSVASTPPKTVSPSTTSRTAIPRRPRKKTVSPSTTPRTVTPRKTRKKKG